MIGVLLQNTSSRRGRPTPVTASTLPSTNFAALAASDPVCTSLYYRRLLLILERLDPRRVLLRSRSTKKAEQPTIMAGGNVEEKMATSTPSRRRSSLCTMEASFSSPTLPSAKRPGTSSTASLSSTTLKVETQIASLPGANRIPSVTRCLESRSQSREETPTWSFAPTSAGAPSVMRSIVPPRRPPRAGANNNNNN